MKYRYERFGGILAGNDPPFLAFVDRDYMRGLGVKGSPIWAGSSGDNDPFLSAPTEVHLAITNRCPGGCQHCYVDAGEPDPDEMDTQTFRKALKALADMGVFHVALGGGEALMRDDLFELAAYAREVGMVPNLTVSGFMMTVDIAKRMDVFGQVNVSLDGVGGRNVFRGIEHFRQADHALTMLTAAGIATGINTVVGRRNVDGIPELVDYAQSKGLNEVELLRLKPSGRGGPVYEIEKCTLDQSVRLAPMLSALVEKTNIRLKIDCSFMPMLCYHRPDPDMLYAAGAFGCEAGNVLMGGKSNGSLAGCSFLKPKDVTVFNLQDAWSGEALSNMRSLYQRLAEPCKSCDYLTICKGGCRAVSDYVLGDIEAPDPDCPWVVAYHQARNNV